MKRIRGEVTKVRLIQSQGEEVVVITPQSPLGQTLMGRKAGDHWTTKLAGATVKYHILSIW